MKKGCRLRDNPIVRSRLALGRGIWKILLSQPSCFMAFRIQSPSVGLDHLRHLWEVFVMSVSAYVESDSQDNSEDKKKLLHVVSL